MNEPTMKEIAEWLKVGATRCEDMRDLLEGNGCAHVLDSEASKLRLVAAQVEAVGERKCRSCTWLDDFEDDTFGCLHSNSIVQVTRPDFGCIHWKRKEE